MLRRRTILIILVLFIFLAGGGFIFFSKFEGEVPTLNLTPEPDILGTKTTFNLTAKDRRSGLKAIRVEILQGERNVVLLEKAYASGTSETKEVLDIVPGELNLQDGEAFLRAEVRDRSWRRGGNPNMFEAAITIDTHPPKVGVVSRFHYVQQGGTCLVMYRAAEELARSGVKVGDLWFPGFPLGDGGYLSLFAIPYHMATETPVELVAEDLAGNVSRTTFPYRIRPRAFRRDTIRVSDGFLRRAMPYFMDRDPSLKGELLEVFLRVNRHLRKANAEDIRALCQETHPRPLWSGPFLSMANAKKMAGFADHRVYTYKGKEIDRQVHLGVDLASVVMSPVKAANRGRVVFADELGIYGNTVILDHGCGLFSMYSHLSRMDVDVGQALEKGDPLGRTGTTGLAGGDHLHFSILVSGIFVNPLEWWDPHWVEDNVNAKWALLRSQGG